MTRLPGDMRTAREVLSVVPDAVAATKRHGNKVAQRYTSGQAKSPFCGCGNTKLLKSKTCRTCYAKRKKNKRRAMRTGVPTKVNLREPTIDREYHPAVSSVLMGQGHVRSFGTHRSPPQQQSRRKRLDGTWVIAFVAKGGQWWWRDEMKGRVGKQDAIPRWRKWEDAAE